MVISKENDYAFCNPNHIYEPKIIFITPPFGRKKSLDFLRISQRLHILTVTQLSLLSNLRWFRNDVPLQPSSPDRDSTVKREHSDEVMITSGTENVIEADFEWQATSSPTSRIGWHFRWPTPCPKSLFTIFQPLLRSNYISENCHLKGRMSAFHISINL